MTNAAVVVTDDLVLVTDPNWLPSEVTAIRDYVAEVRGTKPVFLLFTHSDYDHILGYRAFSDATAIASEAFVRNPHKRKIVREIQAFDDSYYITRPYPIEYPHIDIVIQEDGQELRIGTTLLRFYQAPGHNPDGLITQLFPDGILLTGDYLCDVEFPYIYHSSTAYETTLNQLENILSEGKIRLLIPGHGKPAHQTLEALSRLQQARAYIHQLKDSVRTGIPFDEEVLLKQFPFPLIQRAFHRKNLALIRKELSRV